MTVLLSTGSVHHLDPERAFWLAGKAGFGGVELLIDRRWADVGVDMAKRYAEHYGVPVRHVHAPFSLIDRWGDYWGNVRQSLKWTRLLGAELINIHPVAPLKWIGRRRRLFGRRLEGLRDAAKQHGITVAIENLPRGRTPFARFGRRLATFKSVVELAENWGVKVTLDTTHLGTWHADVLACFTQADGLVGNLHLSDHSPGHQHLLPRQGRLPLDNFLAAIRGSGNTTPLTLETCPDAIGSSRPEKVLQRLTAARKFITRHAGR